MTLRDIPTNIAIAICSYIIIACKDILDSHPLLKASYAYAVEVHDVLTKSITEKEETTIEKLSKLATALDKLHDALNRGVHGVLSAFAEFTSDEQERSTLVQIRELLYPMNLRVNMLSFSAQVGEAKRLAEQLKDSTLRKQLQELSIRHGKVELTVLEALEEIVRVGQKLEETLSKLSTLKAQQKSQSNTQTNDTNEAQARLMFYQLIRMLQENARIALRDKPESQNRLWQKLDEELSKGPSPSKSSKETATQNAETTENTNTPSATSSVTE